MMSSQVKKLSHWQCVYDFGTRPTPEANAVS